MMRGSSDGDGASAGGFGNTRKPIGVAISFASLGEWVMLVRLDGRREGEDGLPWLIGTFRLKGKWPKPVTDAIIRKMRQISWMAEQANACPVWEVETSTTYDSSVKWGSAEVFSVRWPMKKWMAIEEIIIELRRSFVFGDGVSSVML